MEMLDRLRGISTLEGSWLPKAGAVVLLWSTGPWASAEAQQVPRRLSPELTAAVIPAIHAVADPVVKRLPPVVDDAAPSPKRLAQAPSPQYANPSIGWSTPGGPTGTGADLRVKRLPPVQTPVQNGVVRGGSMSLTSRPQPSPELRVKRLPPVDQVATLPAYGLPTYPAPQAAPSHEPAVLPTPAYPLPNASLIQRDVPSYAPRANMPPLQVQPAPLQVQPEETSRYESSPLPITRPITVKPYVRESIGGANDRLLTPRQTRELSAASARADALVRRGFSMAGRGAIYSARADFTEALSMIAQTVDRQQNSNRRVRALALGLRAINEAEQFQPIGSELGADLDVASIIASHRTDVLKGEISEAGTLTMTLSEARDRYHTYASEQLTIASGNVPVASLALYGLGKVRASQATERPTMQKIHFPAAMALYQAAALVDGQNFRATNELGVLSAKLGRHEEARSALQQSVSVSPTRETWRNLAVVHQQLGEAQLAQQAQSQADRTPAMNAPGNAHPVLANSNVRWVSPQAFARTGAANVAMQNTPAPTAQRPAADRQNASNAKSSVSKWLPWVK